MVHRNLSAQFFLSLFLLFGLGSCYGNTTVTDPRSAAARLVALLQDQDPQIRLTAAQALGKIALPETAGALVRST